MDQRVVLITGASSGIGSALAAEYAARGARVALVARRTDRLEELARTLGADRALGVQADVCKDGELERAVGEVLAKFGRLDVVVANAGFSVSGRTESLTLDDYRRQFETNVFGMLRTVYASLDAIKETRGAYALVGSVSGFVSVPGYTAYSMSKYAVRAFAEALTLELAPYGVSVTHVAPGFVESEIRSVDKQGLWRADRKDPVPPWIIVPKAKAAREIADAIDARRAEAIISHHGRLLATLARHAQPLMYGILRAGRSLIPTLD